MTLEPSSSFRGAIRAKARAAATRVFNLFGLDVVSKGTIENLLARARVQRILPPEAESDDPRVKLAWYQQALSDYQLQLERNYDYQSAMAQEQIRAGMATLEPEFLALYEKCKPFTMTSWERMYALFKSVLYIADNCIPGAIVECGVWRGGSMKLAAHTLQMRAVNDRKIFLYDTFEGMTEPQADIDLDFAGNKAIDDWAQAKRKSVKWAYAPIEEVRQTMIETGYPANNIALVKGPVEKTIPGTIPDRMALLRLDTDWYSSTKHEMEHLYPRLAAGGVLLLDDYGHYQGARRGVDEYLATLKAKPLLHRIDYSCMAAVKPAA